MSIDKLVQIDVSYRQEKFFANLSASVYTLPFPFVSVLKNRIFQHFKARCKNKMGTLGTNFFCKKCGKLHFPTLMISFNSFVLKVEVIYCADLFIKYIHVRSINITNPILYILVGFFTQWLKTIRIKTFLRISTCTHRLDLEILPKWDSILVIISISIGH